MSIARFGGRFAAAVVLTGLVLTASGCKSLLKKKTGDAGVKTTTTLTPQDLADEQLQEKIDEYIKCLNTLSTPIHKSRGRYLVYIPRTGPTGREQYADLYRLPANATTNCSVGVSPAQVMPPPQPNLETAGREFSLAASDIDRLMNEMEQYYELKLFRDDKWLKGKVMHPRLMAAWDRFSRADKTLHDTLDGVTKPLAQRVLSRIEREDGRKFRYGRKKVLIDAREVIEAANPSGDDDTIDLALYAAEYIDLEKSLDELMAYGNSHRPELNNSTLAPTWPMAESNYNAFIRDATDFKRTAKDFYGCLRDAPAKAKTPSGKIDMEKLVSCGGTPAWKTADETIKHYNTFIHTSNAQQFP